MLKFGRESLMIIFSVLFALLLNEWRSNASEYKKTGKLIENLKAEITTNESVIKKLILYHESIRLNVSNAYSTNALAEKFFANESFDIMEVAPDGIMQERLFDIAWTVAKFDKISNRIALEKTTVLLKYIINNKLLLKPLIE